MQEITTRWPRVWRLLPVLAAAIIGVGISTSAWLSVAAWENRIALHREAARVADGTMGIASLLTLISSHPCSKVGGSATDCTSKRVE